MVLHELGVGVIGMGCIDEMGVRASREQALAGLERDMHPQVSFDVECLDPDIAPGRARRCREGRPTARRGCAWR